MKKENFLNLGKRLSASVVAAAIVFSTASVLPSFAAEESVDSTQLHATGLIPDSKEVIEEHLASDEEVYDLDFIQSNDSATEDALVGICKAAKVASLPEKAELNHKYLPPVGNQGSIGSCASWATVYYLKSYQEAEEHDWDLSDENTKHLFSPSFTYSQLAISDSSGSSESANLDIIVNQGACPLYDMKYRSCVYKPNDSQKDIASNFKGSKNPDAGQWHSIKGLDAIKNCLANGQPVSVGISVYKQFDRLTKEQPLYNSIDANAIKYDNWLELSVDERKKTDYFRGNHAICLVGYDENYNYNGETISVFKFVNSWGTDWGENGYAYITESLLSDFTFSTGYILDDKSDSDFNDFFTSKPAAVMAKVDIRAYSSADYFVAEEDKDNYVKSYPAGSTFRIKKFVSSSESNQQPYLVTDDGYYINAQKSSLTELDVNSGTKVIINGDKNNSVYNYNNSESSKIIITPNSSEKYNNHNTLKIDYTINKNDSYNGYAGATIKTDSTVNASNTEKISFKYMTPKGQNGTIALCLQGSVNKKLVQLPTTNGEWKTYIDEYTFNNSSVSEIEIYLNGNENNCQTTLSDGTLYIAELGIGTDNIDVESCEFTLSADDGYSSLMASQNGFYPKGAHLEFTIEIKPQYKFLGWSKTKGGEIISTDLTYSFNIENDTSLYANIERSEYSVTIFYSTINGKVTSTVGSEVRTGIISGNAAKDTPVTVTAEPKDEYIFIGWYTRGDYKGVPVCADNSYTFTLNQNVTLYPKFAKAEYMFRVYSTPNYMGTVDSDQGFNAGHGIVSGEAISGTNITVTAKPNKGYKFIGWYDGSSNDANLISKSATYTFTLNKETNLYAKFEEKVPEHIFRVYFRTSEGSVDYSLGTMYSQGTISGSCVEGTDITVTAKPNKGYKFIGWYDGSSNDANLISKSATYTFSLNKETNLYAKFEEKVPEHIFRVYFRTSEGTVDCSQGTMYIQGTISGSCVEGTDITVTAKPNNGYKFIGWYDGSSNDANLISKSATYTFTLNKETNLYAKFEEKVPEHIFRVYFRTSEGSVDYSLGTMYSQGTISGSCVEGTDITVTAKPNKGYKFVGWCDGSYDGTVLSTSSTYTFTVNKETDLYAKFAEETVSDDSNILVKGISNNISSWTNANSGSYLNITSGSSDYLFNGAKTLKLDYNINTYDQYGGYAGRTVSLESTYKNDSSKGYNGIGFWYMTPADFNGQIALCLQSQSAGLDDLVQLPATNGEWKYYFYQTDKTNLSDLTLYINGSKNGYTTTASNGIAKGTLYMANIEVAKK